MESLWKKELQRPAFKSLKGDKKTDVLIIGGGLSGLLCAYLLKNSGVDCALVEADRICSGITAGSTAKITLQHGLIYDSLIRKFGWERARMYLEANRSALEAYQKLCRDIPCDFEEKDNYVYTLHDREKLEWEMRALERLGQEASLVEALPLPIDTAGAVMVPAQAQFHPLKFAFGIAKELPIYENTRILELMPHAARTEHGTIRAHSFIVATHFPFINKHGSYFMKLYQHRSYILALNNAQNVDGMYVDNDQKGFSFRNHGDTLLLGGGGHRTGKKGGCWQELEDFARRHYPGAECIGKWAAQDCMSLDTVPYIGRYSRRTPNMFVATGFNKWGISSSMVGAILLRDMLLGKKNPWEELFSPSRSMLHPQLAVNALESSMNLLTPTRPRCPHMGCALKYNVREHSWDCPCHGSRFDKDGALLDNPATGNLKGK